MSNNTQPSPLLPLAHTLSTTIEQLFITILPHTTPTGFPSQYTLQTFNNNRDEQSIALHTAATTIVQQLNTIKTTCDDIKATTNQYCEDYYYSQQQSQHLSALPTDGVELDEEQQLLLDILLLEKELKNGEALIVKQRQRMGVVKSMLDQVALDQHHHNEATLGSGWDEENIKGEEHHQQSTPIRIAATQPFSTISN